MSYVTFPGCKGWFGRSKPPDVTCPPIIGYPDSPAEIDVLFVGWNPPGQDHFWTSPDDKLRADLNWVLEQLPGWTSTSDFMSDFLRQHFYLTHAVKCWMRAKPHPSPDIIRTCAGAVLQHEIKGRPPRVLCLLGQVPHRAAWEIFDKLPHRGFHYGDGWHGTLGRMDVIITTFPTKRKNPLTGKQNRWHTLVALKRWLTPLGIPSGL